jgi:SAM-dependent methyltransferase
MDPDRYDRVRPRYPDALVKRIAAAGPRILDVGCGTGIAGRQLQAVGCTVLGVEPDARMASFARARGLEVEVARFEAWEPAGRSFDAVMAASCWHWIDPLAGVAKAAEALRPGGLLAIFWTGVQPPAPLRDEFAAVYRRILPDSPAPTTANGHSALIAQARDAMCGFFAEPEQWRFECERTETRDEWLEGMRTGADVARLPPAEREELLAGIGAAIDAAGGSLTVRLTTVAVAASHLDLHP